MRDTFVLTPKNKQLLAMQLCNYYMQFNKKPVFLCVGSAKFTTDSVGPLVGSILQSNYNIPYMVYGSLIHNVHYENIETYLKLIKQNFPQNPLVVIDSTMSDYDNLYTTTIKNSGIIVGSTQQKPLYVGNLSICANTHTTGANALIFLKPTQLDKIIELSNFIATSVNLSLKYYKKLNNLKDDVETIPLTKQTLSKAHNGYF